MKRLSCSDCCLKAKPTFAVACGYSVALVKGLRLNSVVVVGELPAGLPQLRLPHFPLGTLDELAAGAISLADRSGSVRCPGHCRTM